jgi:hypothetical protein
MLPLAKIALETKALRYLEARDDLTLDSLVALVRTLGD